MGLGSSASPASTDHLHRWVWGAGGKFFCFCLLYLINKDGSLHVGPCPCSDLAHDLLNLLRRNLLGDSLRHEGGIWLCAVWVTTLLSLVYTVMLEITEVNERVSVSRKERMIQVWWIMEQCQSLVDCGNTIIHQHCTKSV